MSSFRLRILLVPFLACIALLGAVLLLPAAASATRPEAHGMRPTLLRATTPIAVRATAPDPALIKMTIRDVVPLPEAHTHAVVLMSDKDDVILPVFVGEETALAVALRLAHKASPAPLAADLLGGMLHGLGGKLVAVKLDSLVEDEFTGRVQFSKDGENFEVPARPADALAVALDSGAQVFATRALLDDVGISRAQIDELRKHLSDHGGGEQDAPGVGGSGPATPQRTPNLPPGIEL